MDEEYVPLTNAQVEAGWYDNPSQADVTTSGTSPAMGSWWSPDDALTRARQEIAAWGGAPDIVKQLDAGTMTLPQLTQALYQRRLTTSNDENVRSLDPILNRSWNALNTATVQAGGKPLDPVPWSKLPQQSDTISALMQYAPGVLLAAATMGGSLLGNGALTAGEMATEAAGGLLPSETAALSMGALGGLQIAPMVGAGLSGAATSAIGGGLVGLPTSQILKNAATSGIGAAAGSALGQYFAPEISSALGSAKSALGIGAPTSDELAQLTAQDVAAGFGSGVDPAVSGAVSAAAGLPGEVVNITGPLAGLSSDVASGLGSLAGGALGATTGALSGAPVTAPGSIVQPNETVTVTGAAAPPTNITPITTAAGGALGGIPSNVSGMTDQQILDQIGAGSANTPPETVTVEAPAPVADTGLSSAVLGAGAVGAGGIAALGGLNGASGGATGGASSGASAPSNGVVQPGETVTVEAPAPVMDTGLSPAVLGAAGAGGLTAAEVAANVAATDPNTATPDNTTPADTSKTPMSTIDKFIAGLKAAGLLSSVLGGVGGSSSSGGDASAIPGGLSNAMQPQPIFSAHLPELSGASGPAGGAGGPRDMSGINWSTYGQRPEESFFQNVPQRPKPVAAAHGGSMAVLRPPRAGFAVRGPGNGRSDDVPATLSDGEYVMDAETVALLGNGSNKAGAAALDRFRANVRKHKGKELSKGRFSVAAKQPQAYLRGGRT